MGLHIQDWMSAHTEDSREHMFQILINSKEAFCQYFTPSASWCWETAVGFGVGDVVGVDVEAVLLVVVLLVMLVLHACLTICCLALDTADG